MQELQADQRREAVLSKAVCRASEALGLKQAELARVLGVSGATASRLFSGAYVLPHGSKEYELGALLVRVFRSLDAITGGDAAVKREWMRNRNTALAGVPAELIVTITGLTHVLDYLDSRRAKV